MAPLNMVRLMAGRAVRQPAFPTSIRLRPLHQSSLLRVPRKDSQEKDSINTDASEYTKSGTDDDAARNEKAAFDPSQTVPGEEKDKAGEGNETNPLEVSPANPDVSKQRPEQEEGASNSLAESSNSERKQSGHGSPNKGKKV